jgi:hypothetical protein
VFGAFGVLPPVEGTEVLVELETLTNAKEVIGDQGRKKIEFHFE